MTQSGQDEKFLSPEAEWREARAQRILDAASTLILRNGYHKTSVEDIAREAQNNTLSTEVLADFTSYLEVLRTQGLVRTDLSLPALMTLFSSIFIGFFLAAPLLSDAFKPSDEELAELMAETVHCRPLLTAWRSTWTIR